MNNIFLKETPNQINRKKTKGMKISKTYVMWSKVTIYSWLLSSQCAHSLLVVLSCTKNTVFRVNCWNLCPRMAEPNYPYTWEDLSPEDDATVKKSFGENGQSRNLVRFVFIINLLVLTVRSNPDLIRVGISFRNHYKRVWNIKVDFYVHSVFTTKVMNNFPLQITLIWMVNWSKIRQN